MTERLLRAIFGCAMVLTLVAGCVPFRAPEGPTHVLQDEFAVLPEAELIVPLGGPVRVWVTNQPELKLIFESEDYRYPTEIRFFARTKRTRPWELIAHWRSRDAIPVWKPSDEGRWEITAVVDAKTEVDVNTPPLAVIVVDQTAPEVTIGRGLPAEPVRGGGTIPLRWKVRDFLYGTESVVLEAAFGHGDRWQEIAEVPNTGVYDWPVPNRNFAGARMRLSVTDAAGNSRRVLIPGSLTVYGISPTVDMAGDVITSEEKVRIPYESSTEDLARVELWVTRDEGDTWLLAGYDQDQASPLELAMDEGQWGYAIVFVDGGGNRSEQPVPGDRPKSRLVVDRTPPVVTWGEARAQRVEGLGTLGRGTIEVKLAYEIDEVDLDRSSIAVRSEIGGLWIDVSGTYGQVGEIELDHPPVSTPLRVRISGRDRAGHTFEADHELWPLELVDPPTIEFTDAPAGWHAAGAAVVLGYRTDWNQALEDSVDLAYSVDGVSWQPIASGLPPAGSIDWTLPEVNSHDVRLRLTVHGRHRRARIAYNTTQFGVDNEAPTAKIIGPSTGYGDPVHVFVEGFDTGSGVESLELYSRRQGAPGWQFSAKAKISEGTLPFRPVNEGPYDLWVVAVDRSGNRSGGPEQAGEGGAFAFLAESTPPGIRLISFQEGGIFAGGTRHVVFVDFVGETPSGGTLTLEYSPDDGGTWRPIQAVPLSSRQVAWTLPKSNLGAVRVRARAVDAYGYQYEDMSREPFAIDSMAPDVVIVDAVPVSTGVRVRYRAEDEGGGVVSQIVAYYTRDDGHMWEEYPEPFVEEESFVLPLSIGRYGLALVGIDNAQNRGAAPARGMRPEIYAEVGRAVDASIALLGPHGGIFPGGSRHFIFWRLESLGVAFADYPVRLEYRVEGGAEWTEIAAGLPPKGKHPWYVPELPSGSQIELRVAARDLEGTTYTDLSRNLLDIDTSIPNVVYTAPDTSNRRPTEFEYQVEGDEQLEFVELWARPVSQREWKRITETRVGQPMLADLPDGMYWVSLVGVDRAGNRGRPPVAGESGQARLRVDTVKPQLTVDRVGDRDRLFHEGEAIAIRPIVTDNQELSAWPVAVRFSHDGGQSFETVERFLPRGNEFSWRLPTKPGVYYIEVTAEDLAGNTDRQTFPVQVIATPPKIQLLIDPGGGSFAAGHELRLEWESEGVDPIHRGTKLEVTLDGETWSTLGADLPADGSTVWKVPEVDSTRCQIRLQVTRPDGVMGRAWSGRFTISKTVPKVEVRGARPSSGRSGSGSLEKPRPGGIVPDNGGGR